jgi:hypothetical protein
MRQNLDVAVTREGAKRIIRRFSTVLQAEKFIAKLELRNPRAVYAGEYGIDSSEAAHNRYQRYRNAQRERGQHGS